MNTHKKCISYGNHENVYKKLWKSHKEREFKMQIAYQYAIYIWMLYQATEWIPKKKILIFQIQKKLHFL